LAWIDADPNVIPLQSYSNIMVRDIVAGLQDFPISRQSLSWGIAVPGDPAQTMSVWIDALPNDLSIAG
jgi:methionyl-tRNA synthetase